MEVGKHYCMNCMEPLETDDSVCGKCGFNNQITPEDPNHLPYTVLNGKYLVGKVLGQGGFGITYIGLDLNLLVKVAVKEYYPKDLAGRTLVGDRSVIPYTGDKKVAFFRGREKFLAEAQTIARFSGITSIVKVRDYFMEHGTAYIVMDFVQGISLKEMIQKRETPMSFNEVFALLEPLMDDLALLHQKNMIHRDISPDNIIITDEHKPVLLDFGAAREYVDNEEHEYTVNLKHGYAPPEQYSFISKQGPYTDVYALCATFYATICGKKPPMAMDRLLNNEQLMTPSQRGVVIAPHQEQGLLHGLELDAQTRTPNMETLKQELQHGKKIEPAIIKPLGTPPANAKIQTGLPRSAPAHATASKSTSKSKWRKWVVVLLVVFGGLSAFLVPQLKLDQFQYHISDGEISIDKYIGDQSAAVVPSQILFFPVVQINAYAFAGNQDIFEVVVEDGIKTINEYAFSNCPRLQSIQLPQTLEVLETAAFDSCIRLGQIELPDSLTLVSDSTFYNCAGLTSVDFSEETMRIGTSAFEGCTSLYSIDLPNRLHTIEKKAFANCSSLQELVLPLSLSHVETQAFLDCVQLISVRLPDFMKECAINAFDVTHESQLRYIYCPSEMAWTDSEANFPKDATIICPKGAIGIATLKINKIKYKTGTPESFQLLVDKIK